MCSRATCPGNGRDLSRVVRDWGPHKDLSVLLGLLLYYYGAGTCLSLSFSGLWSCPSECRVLGLRLDSVRGSLGLLF